MKNFIRKIIRENINCLFESFDMKNENRNYVPTTEVSKTAQIALEAINGGATPLSIDTDGNQGSGKLKAKQLSQKQKQSFSEMKRLKNFFDSNSQKVEEERKRIGITQQKKGTIYEMKSSNILLVWNLHGGDQAQKWVASKLSDTHNQGVHKKDRLRKVGGADTNNGMGVFKTQYDPSQHRIHR